jgi:membrane protease YdiL (CAAX protease family)
MSATNIRLEKKFEEVPWTLQQTFTGILFTLVVGLVTMVSFEGLKISPAQPLSPDRDLANAIVYFVCGLILDGVLLIAPIFYARRAVREASARGDRLSEERDRSVLQTLGFRGFNWSRALFWLLMCFVVICLANFLYHLLIQTSHLSVQTIEQNVLARGKNQPLTVYGILITCVLVAPVCEEVFFRGFVLMGLARAMPVWLAIGISSFLFGVAHTTELGTLPVLFFIGLALGFLRWHTRSLWPSILLQLLINSSASLLIVLAMNGIGT